MLGFRVLGVAPSMLPDVLNWSLGPYEDSGGALCSEGSGMSGHLGPIGAVNV